MGEISVEIGTSTLCLSLFLSYPNIHVQHSHISNTRTLNRSSRKWKYRIRHITELEFEGKKNPIITRDEVLVVLVTCGGRVT